MDEIFIALGFPVGSWQRRLLWPFFWLPADKFATLAVGIDKDIGLAGIRQAARQLLSRFRLHVDSHAIDAIPKVGPLVFASNHPGAFDAVIIIATQPRNDLKIIVSDVPFLRGLENVKEHFIFASGDAHERMNALRTIFRHLKNGGATIIFPSGRLDPDPDVQSGARQALNLWSPSLELGLRKVPDVSICPTIVSGVLAPVCLRNPITRLPKEKWRQQKLAEFFQVMQQLFFPKSFNLTPRITFGSSFTYEDLGQNGKIPSIMPTIIEKARTVLDEHMMFGSEE